MTTVNYYARSIAIATLQARDVIPGDTVRVRCRGAHVTTPHVVTHVHHNGHSVVLDMRDGCQVDTSYDMPIHFDYLHDGGALSLYRALTNV